MNNFIFQNSTKVYFGQGCVKEYLACLTRQADTILLAYGGGSIKRNGVYDEIMDIFYKAGKQVVEFSGIMANPTYAKVQEGGPPGPGVRRRHDPGGGRRQRHGLLQGGQPGRPLRRGYLG